MCPGLHHCTSTAKMRGIQVIHRTDSGPSPVAFDVSLSSGYTGLNDVRVCSPPKGS